MKVCITLEEPHLSMLKALKQERMTKSNAQIVREALRAFAEKICPDYQKMVNKH